MSRVEQRQAADPDGDPTRGLLHRGPLGLAGGVIVFGGLPGEPTQSMLYNEAVAAFPGAERQYGEPGVIGPDRTRIPARALSSAAGGPVQDQFYASPDLHAFIGQQVGVPVRPSGNRGSYSYYVEPGDFLDLHLDVYGCDVTLITVLHDSTDGAGRAAALAVYRQAAGQSLASVSAAEGLEPDYVRVSPGDSVLILGGLVPHRVVPLGSTGSRIISPLCFQAVGGRR